MGTSKNTTDARRERGECIVCGGTRDELGYVSCSACRRRITASGRALEARRLAAGVCVRCARNPPIPGKRYCGECRPGMLEKYNAGLEAENLKAKGLKRCCRCKEVKPLGEYHLAGKNPDGSRHRRNQCGSCISHLRGYYSKSDRLHQDAGHLAQEPGFDAFAYLLAVSAFVQREGVFIPVQSRRMKAADIPMVPLVQVLEAARR